MAISLIVTSAGTAASFAAEPTASDACTAAIAHSQQPGLAARPIVAQSLAGHNAERTRLGLPPLAWNCRLEHEAAGWANRLVEKGKLEHASADRRNGTGENLWMGSAGRFPVEHMVSRFIEEKRFYRHGTFPDISHTGNWTDVGHYSQIVWRDTHEVGCALAEGTQSDVLVCRYYPAGNIRGRAAF